MVFCRDLHPKRRLGASTEISLIDATFIKRTVPDCFWFVFARLRRSVTARPIVSANRLKTSDRLYVLAFRVIERGYLQSDEILWEFRIGSKTGLLASRFCCAKVAQ